MNDITRTQESQVSPEKLPVITWQQAKVITTELLAKLYGASDQQLRQNFNNNASRFVEGKHFFKLEGDALRTFKDSVENFDAVQKRARNLILWTERGAARHAKMLDTDAAWEVFEKLEDCYFAVKQIMESASYTAGSKDILTASQAEQLRVAMRLHCDKLPKAQQASFMIKGWSKLKSHFGVTYRKIPQHEFSEALSLVSRHTTEWELLEAVKEPAIQEPALLPMSAKVNLQCLCSHVAYLHSWYQAYRKAFEGMNRDITMPVSERFSVAAFIAEGFVKDAGIQSSKARADAFPWRASHEERIRHNMMEGRD